MAVKRCVECTEDARGQAGEAQRTERVQGWISGWPNNVKGAEGSQNDNTTKKTKKWTCDTLKTQPKGCGPVPCVMEPI